MTEQGKLRMNLQFFAKKDEVTEPDPTPEEKIEADPEKDSKTEVKKEDKKIDPEPTVDPEPETVKTAEVDSQVSDLNDQLSTANSEIEQLTQQVAELQGLNDETAQELKQAEEKIASYEKVLDEIAAEQEKAIPENIKSLMPDGMSVEQKLEWLSKAAGVKPDGSKDKKVVEIGKPTPVNDQHIDQSELSARQKMANAFSGIFSK